MSKFFDPQTRTLHEVVSYAGAVKIPQDVVERKIPVREYSPLNALGPLDHPIFRRIFGGGFPITMAPLFFSTNNQMLYRGHFDTEHSTNNDLIPISNSVRYS